MQKDITITDTAAQAPAMSITSAQYALDWQARIQAAVNWNRAQGIPIFAVHGVIDGKCTCGKDHAENPKQIGKHPATANGFKNATTDPAQLARMFNEHEVRNIAMPTGTTSRIIVMDIDGERGEKTLRELEKKHGALPITRVIKTGQGRHICFQNPARPISSFQNPETKIDLRAEGGYVLVPPSRHRLGHEYQVQVDVPIVPAPEWLVNWLETEGRKSGKKKSGIEVKFAFLDEGIPAHLKNIKFPKIDFGILTSHETIEHTQENEGALREALQCISADCCRDIWFRILCGIKSLCKESLVAVLSTRYFHFLAYF